MTTKITGKTIDYDRNTASDGLDACGLIYILVLHRKIQHFSVYLMFNDSFGESNLRQNIPTGDFSLISTLRY